MKSDKNKNHLLGVISQIEKELENLAELDAEFESLTGQKGIPFNRARGSIFHDFYNCCERIFRKIAMELNGEYADSEKWHKDLLQRMVTPIKGIRPRVISDELAAELDEFLSFRHLFRNIYGFELKGNRIDHLAEKFKPVSKKFRAEITVFMKSIKKG